MPREKRSFVGTKINIATATNEQRVRSSHYLNNFRRAMDACEELRREWEVAGVDPFVELARIVAHNHAVKKDVSRLRAKGAEPRKRKAAEHAKEIIQQLAESGGNVKAVSIDRETRDKPASSESTIRRAKKSAPGGSR